MTSNVKMTRSVKIMTSNVKIMT